MMKFLGCGRLFDSSRHLYTNLIKWLEYKELEHGPELMGSISGSTYDERRRKLFGFFRLLGFQKEDSLKTCPWKAAADVKTLQGRQGHITEG